MSAEIQLQLLDPDPDWPGSTPRPDGDGWVWCSNEPDVVRRFGDGAHLEMSMGPGPGWLPARHVRIYDYGPGLSPLGAYGGTTSPGAGLAVNLTERDGTWARRVRAPAWWRP